MIRRRILINGFEPTSLKESPVWDPLQRRLFEVWSFNDGMKLIKFAQRHFEMHELSVYGPGAVDDARPNERYLSLLRRGLGIPVYHLRESSEIPGSIAYPLEEMVARFGPYFTNTFSYMLALAISESVDEIHLYGVDMAREHEHAWERPSIEYFLGWARGAGIRVVIPETSDLLKCIGHYGYGEANVYEMEAVERARVADLRDAADAYRQSADRMMGASDELDYWIRRRSVAGDPSTSHTNAKARARKRWFMERYERYVRAVGKYDRAAPKTGRP